MSSSQAIDRRGSHRHEARTLLWPTAVIAFVFTVSYPANDFAPPASPPDIGGGMLLVYVAIAAATVGLVFAVVLPWAMRRESSGGLALGLAIPGALLAPGFWTGFPPGLAAGGALLGWAGIQATKGRQLSRAAFVIGVLGFAFNVVNYADVFI